MCVGVHYFGNCWSLVLILCDMKSVDIVTNLLCHNINGYLLGKYVSVYGQPHRQEEYSSSAQTFFEFIYWFCKYLNENQTSHAITLEQKLVAVMYEICAFGENDCYQCIECGNQNDETLQTNSKAAVTLAVALPHEQTINNENSSDNISTGHDKLLNDLDQSKGFVMRLRNNIERYELNYSFNTVKWSMLCSTSKLSGFRMLLTALYQSQTLNLLSKFTDLYDEQAHFNDVTISARGFRIVIPFIMVSKINWLLLPFYVLFIDCFYNYKLEDIDIDLKNSNALDAKFFYTFYFFIKIWCSMIIGVYTIILYINIKHLIPLYSTLFYVFSDKCCHDFIYANGVNSAREKEINDYMQIEVTNEANQSVILLEYIDDLNIVRIVFEYCPVHYF